MFVNIEDVGSNKATVQEFKATIKHCKKWRNHREVHKSIVLHHRAKKPHKRVKMMWMYWQFNIKAVTEKAIADKKRINGIMTKKNHTRYYPAKAVVT